MDDKVVKEALSYSLGSDLHEAWCRKELQAYFYRAQKALLETHNFGEAFRKACYQGEERRNEVEIDIGYLVAHETSARQCLTDFDIFMDLFNRGVIDVKMFVERELTPEEIEKIGPHYVDGKENVLRDFHSLSKASQQVSLNAARVAIDLVYDQTIAGENISSEDSRLSQVQLAQAKVRDYMDGLIDVDAICDQYGITRSGNQFS